MSPAMDTYIKGLKFFKHSDVCAVQEFFFGTIEEPEINLTSWELMHCAMRGKYGLLLNWGDWTPNELERYELFDAAEEAALKEGEEA